MTPATRAIVTRIRIPLGFLITAIVLAEQIRNRIPFHDPAAFLKGKVDIVAIAGVCAIATGIAIRAWAAGIVRKGKAVCKDGPYAIVRHPLYLGSFLVALGFCAILENNRYIFVVLAFLLLIYCPKIRAEEEEMTEKFGADYVRYRAEVPAFLPLRIPRSARSPWNARQYFAHREYRAGLTALIALGILGYLA